MYLYSVIAFLSFVPVLVHVGLMTNSLRPDDIILRQ